MTVEIAYVFLAAAMVVQKTLIINKSHLTMNTVVRTVFILLDTGKVRSKKL